ncbi:MAG: orotate phosphoribosyltransferase [Gammaproteobacteria bacterium]|nr:orotate phosphoribosyltransferase [Gammaproteobacteria bacterium]
MAQKTYQTQFIELAQSVSALSFGEFTLKSGRISPYFFNAGKFNTGESLWKLAECYADKIIDAQLEFDVIFGPAYKGIPLVSAISVILSQKTGKTIPWAFNRKEAKSHGEGGTLVGSDITGKVLIVDDVITAGTAIREVIDILANSDSQICDVLVAVDRQEIAPNTDSSAMQLIERDYGINTHAVIKLDNLIEYSKNSADAMQFLPALESYRKQYGVK